MIRFKIIKTGKIIELILDSRLSFKDNLELLSEIADEDFNNVLIYDPIKKIFLDTDVELSRFNISYFMTLHLFS